jgi:hypothetical protein
MSESPKPVLVFFATNDCPRAKWKRRTRVLKINSDPGDTHPDGVLGVVLGSIVHSTFGIAYFVEWDPGKGIPELVAEKKLTPASPQPQSAAKPSRKKSDGQ